MDRDEGARRLMKPLAVLGRYKYVLLVAALGAALLLWPTAAGTAAENAQAAEETKPASLRETEEAMERILGKISGVGQVDVMLTLQSGRALVLAEDTTLRYSGSAQAPSDYQRSAETVTSPSGVVVTQERCPQYRGALVVCDGGGNDAVRLQVVSAVSSLTGLGADRVTVVKRQSGGTGAGS